MLSPETEGRYTAYSVAVPLNITNAPPSAIWARVIPCKRAPQRAIPSDSAIQPAARQQPGLAPRRQSAVNNVEQNNAGMA